MARFYFHIRSGSHLFNDGVGADLVDLRDAWSHAISDARRLIDDQVLDGPVDEHWVEISDDKGAVIAAMPFRYSVQLH